MLYLQGHRRVTSVKLSGAVGLPHLQILLVNPGYLITLLLGLPYLLVNRALCKQSSITSIVCCLQLRLQCNSKALLNSVNIPHAPFTISFLLATSWANFGFCPGVPVHKGITIVLSLFRSHWLAVVYCLVLCSGSCEPVHEERAQFCEPIHS